MIQNLLKTISSICLLTLLSSPFATAEPPTAAQFQQAYAEYIKYADTKQWRDALPYAKSVYDMSKELFAPDSKNSATMAYNYGKNLLEVRNKEDAQAVLGEALSSYEKVYGDDSSELIPLLIDLGRATAAPGNRAYIRYLDRALNLTEAHYGADSVQYGIRSMEVGLVMYDDAYSPFARKHLYRAYDILEEKTGPQSTTTGAAAYNIGRFELAAHDYEDALEYFNKALATFQSPDQPANRLELSTHGFMVEALQQLGKHEEATQHCLAIGRMTPASPVQDYQPVARFLPSYPLEANQRGQEGYVILEYTVDDMGFVRNPKVIERDGPKSFVSASLEAVKNFRYAPRFIDGVPVKTEGVQNKFTYTLAR